MGPVEFKDFSWEALLDSACDLTMGGIAENLARQYQMTREEVDRYASQSFARAVAARAAGFFDDEIVPVVSEEFAIAGLESGGIKLDCKIDAVTEGSHVCVSPAAALAKIWPAFGGVQSWGNSSAVVDGAAVGLVIGVAVGCPPEIMGIGPVPAIRAMLARTGLALGDIDRFEINEAFGVQVVACARQPVRDEDRSNANGGAIVIGRLLGATGIWLVVTLARALRRAGLRRGNAAACIGGGQGIALLAENPDGKSGRK